MLNFIVTPHFDTSFRLICPHFVTSTIIYQGEYMVQKAKTLAGKEFTLMNLPFYLIHRIERELDKLMMNK
jgi:hypothetical protein